MDQYVLRGPFIQEFTSRYGGNYGSIALVSYLHSMEKLQLAKQKGDFKRIVLPIRQNERAWDYIVCLGREKEILEEIIMAFGPNFRIVSCTALDEERVLVANHGLKRDSKEGENLRDHTHYNTTILEGIKALF